MNTHAVVLENGDVERLTGSPELVELSDGQALVQLQEPVRGWPVSGEMTLTCTLSGVLGFRDSRPLDGVKAAASDAINAAWAAADQGHFMYAGRRIRCDAASRKHIETINGSILLTGQFPAGWPGGWKSEDNSLAPIANRADWESFYSAMVSQGMANFAKAQSLKAQISAATTHQEVYAIVWD